MANSNKVQFGLKNCYYAKITETFDASTGKWTTTYEAPKGIPGSVNISLSKDVINSVFYADDASYYSVTKNKGYTGSYEFALVPASVYVDIFGQKRDDNGLLVETIEDKTSYVALMFEIDGNEKATRFCLPRVELQKPNIEGATTGENVEVKTQTCDLTVMSRLDDGVVCISADADTNADAYNSFFTAVPTVAFS